MSLLCRLKCFYLAWLSKPAGNRTLYRALWKQSPSSLVEIGIVDLDRTVRMIHMAQQCSKGRRVRYTAFDEFELAQGREATISLIHAHRALSQTGAKIRLVPGKPTQSLPMAANELTKTEWLVINDSRFADPGPHWFFVPRMLTPASAVHVFDSDHWRVIDRRQVARLSTSDWNMKAA